MAGRHRGKQKDFPQAKPAEPSNFVFFIFFYSFIFMISLQTLGRRNPKTFSESMNKNANPYQRLLFVAESCADVDVNSAAACRLARRHGSHTFSAEYKCVLISAARLRAGAGADALWSLARQFKNNTFLQLAGRQVFLPSSVSVALACSWKRKGGKFIRGAVFLPITVSMETGTPSH